VGTGPAPGKGRAGAVGAGSPRGERAALLARDFTERAGAFSSTSRSVPHVLIGAQRVSCTAGALSRSPGPGPAAWLMRGAAHHDRGGHRPRGWSLQETWGASRGGPWARRSVAAHAAVAVRRDAELRGHGSDPAGGGPPVRLAHLHASAHAGARGRWSDSCCGTEAFSRAEHRSGSGAAGASTPAREDPHDAAFQLGTRARAAPTGTRPRPSVRMVRACRGTRSFFECISCPGHCGGGTGVGRSGVGGRAWRAGIGRHGACSWG
jgi:hypothetical protein